MTSWPWSLEELSLISRPDLSHREAARLTGRTRTAVVNRRRKLRDPERERAEVLRTGSINYRVNCESRERADKHGQPWTQDEDDFIRSTWSECRSDVAYALGRTVYAVAQRRGILVREDAP